MVKHYYIMGQKTKNVLTAMSTFHSAPKIDSYLVRGKLYPSNKLLHYINLKYIVAKFF